MLSLMLKRYSATPAAASATGGAGERGQVAGPATGSGSSTHVSEAARQAVFAPATEQVTEAAAQVVSGRLPSWLRGSLLLNGCGDFRGMQHLFDGYACLSRVRLDGQDNRAWASQRFLDTDAYRSYRTTGRLKYREFGTPAGTPAGPQPESSLLLRLLRSVFNMACGVVVTLTGRQGFSDNASVTLTALPSGQLLALSEPTAATYLVDPNTLAATHHVVYGNKGGSARDSSSSGSGSSGGGSGSSKGRPAAPEAGAAGVEVAVAGGAGAVRSASSGRLQVFRVVDDMVHSDIQTAHIKPIPDIGLVNFSRSLPFGGYHVYVQDPASLRRTQIAFIRDRDPLAPCWVHDMAVTRTHLVVVEAPLHMNLTALMTGSSRQYVFMDWRPEAGTRVHVIALDGSGVVTHTAPALFTFHFSNAFERPSASSPGATELCVDFSVYDDPAILNDLSLKEMMDMPGKDISPSRLRRLTMPLRDAAGKPAGPARLDAPAPLLRDESAYGNFVEFPAFNIKFAGLPYRYCYSTAAVRPTNMGNALAVHDLQEGTSRLWHSPGGMPAEPCFVPRPGSSDEADGVVLAAVVGADGGSSVVVLEGGSLQELARVKLPVAVPYRFHGTFVQQK